jgi:hypothetical protein
MEHETSLPGSRARNETTRELLSSRGNISWRNSSQNGVRQDISKRGSCFRDRFSYSYAFVSGQVIVHRIRLRDQGPSKLFQGKLAPASLKFVPCLLCALDPPINFNPAKNPRTGNHVNHQALCMYGSESAGSLQCTASEWLKWRWPRQTSATESHSLPETMTACLCI